MATLQTVPAAVIAAAQEYGDREAIVDGGVRLTYAQLHDEVRAVARGLIAAGVQPGDRICLWAPNTYRWVLAALGAHYAGATLVPINTRFTGHEALDIIQRTRARALFVSEEFLGVDRLSELRTAAEEEGGLAAMETVVRIPVGDTPGKQDETALPWDVLIERGAGMAVEADARAAAVSPDELSDILFTSGTTGRSKGAMTAHRQTIDVADAWAALGEVTSDDRYLVVNPFFHSFGYKAGIIVCLLRGATLVPQAVFDVDQTLELAERERVTVLPGPPTIYQTMLDHPTLKERDLSPLRLAVTGAATVPVVLIERMREELDFDIVLTAYGLTEAVVATMCRPDDDASTIANTCGRAAAGFEVRIAGAEKPGEDGEVLLRGPNVMRGYLDDPEATTEAIDADGWLHTGDIGRLDERGYLKITDRLKDVFIVGGFNVYPAEVEQAIARLDAVAESAVVGVADERLGEVGKAYVVLRPDRTLGTDELIAFCRERLANYKVPRYVEFVSALPRNAGGKVLKRELRAR